ncbi:MAG: gliding motility lipoprotein GldH [Bacteroidales bacterium]
MTNKIYTFYVLRTLAAGLLVFIAACDPGVVYEKNERIPGGEWSRYNNPVFNVGITDTVDAYNLLVNIRNTGEYPMSNLFLFITAKAPGGATTRDTLELILAEPSGKWKGRGFGSVWQNRFMYKRNVRFPERGTYIFEFEQAMRREELPGIVDVGLRVERSQL